MWCEEQLEEDCQLDCLVMDYDVIGPYFFKEDEANNNSLNSELGFRFNKAVQML